MLLAFILVQLAPFDVKADFVALAKTHCRAEWPDDFQMQGYCLKQQAEGMLKLKAASDSIGKPLEKALEKCTEEWTKERVPDWQMIGHCAETQADAFRKLNSQPPE